MEQSTEVKPVKSRHGCGACRKKRMKCDEGKPRCRNCAYRKIDCPGYARDLKWSTKYERFKPAKQKPLRSLSPLQNRFQEVLHAFSGSPVAEVPSTPAETAPQVIPERLDGDGMIGDAVVTEEARSCASPEFHQVDEQVMAVCDPMSPSETADLYVGGSPSGSGPATTQDQDTTHSEACTAPDAHPPWESRVDDDDQQHIQDEVAMADEYETSLTSRSDLASGQDWLTVSSPAPCLWYEDESSEKLMHHYFSSACRIMSCYDSWSNPYRTTIPSLQHSSSHIKACMMGMSASHMANFVHDMAITAIKYQTKAVEEIASSLPIQQPKGRNPIRSASTYEMLLGAIMLGMTSAWYDPTANATASGMHHLAGARSLFQAWSAEQAIFKANGDVDILDREQSFIIGSMAYWECLSSFIADQSLDAIAYLTPFTKIAEGQTIYPNPWTGVATPIFIRMAQVGVLLRQRRILDRLSCLRSTSYVSACLAEGLQAEAKSVLAAVMAYTLPPDESMENTADPSTPLQHLRDVANIYRFTAILELCQAFPCLAVCTIGPTHDALPLSKTTINDTVYDLASNITSMVAALPRDSGTFTVLCIALICAGGAMQSQHVPRPEAAPGSLEGEMARVRRSRPALKELRINLREQIMHTSRRLGLAAMHRAARLIQQVWVQSDLRVQMGGERGKKSIHWMDVMMEMRLETLFG